MSIAAEGVSRQEGLKEEVDDRHLTEASDQFFSFLLFYDEFGDFYFLYHELISHSKVMMKPDM